MPKPCISQLPGTVMPGHALSSKSGRSKPTGRLAGFGEYLNFHLPLSDRNQGDAARSPRIASSADGYVIIVACGRSVLTCSTAGSSHSSRAAGEGCAGGRTAPGAAATERAADPVRACGPAASVPLSLIHISEPTGLGMISYAVFCL